MATEIETCSCYYLPDDIIFQLLLLLPVKSLVRFKSVCKSWRSIISDRRFIQTHRNQTENTHVLVVLRDDREFLENLYLLNTPTTTQDLLTPTSTQVALPPQFGGKIRFVNHCNGLVCLSNERGNVIYLWNPSTNQFKLLPKPNIRKTKPRFTTRLEFGFDSISDDYKVLSFGSSRVWQDGHRRKVQKAEMYSANSGSWIEIEIRSTLIRFFNFYSRRRHIKIGGVLYLEGMPNSDILWFNLHNEAFGVYKFPDFMQAYSRSNIFDFRGSVATIFESAAGNGDESVYSLWPLLDDGCGKVSWTKKFNLDFYKTRVFCFLGSGHFVTLNDAHECIFSDYSKMKEIKVRLVSAKAVEAQHTSTFHRRNSLVVKYTESLVSLEGFQQLE